MIPKLGVYAVKIKGKDFNKNVLQMLVIDQHLMDKLLLETNIFGFNKNLYNKVINVKFKKFIRAEKIL